MDVLTQSLLGGVLAQSIARKEERRLASLVGVVAGLLADADFLIRSSSDPLLNIEYHRHFTHSLLFIPVGAAITLILFWPFLRKHISLPRLYLFCLAGYSMSGVLDACTSYGTHLFWPFSDERVAWNIISIIDPVLTLILLITFIFGLRIQGGKAAYAGLTISLAYMALGFVQLQRAQLMVDELVMSRGHIASKSVVKPTLGNLLLWRSVYIHDQRIYVDAVRVGLLREGQVFEGESVEAFSLQQDFPGLDARSALYEDIQRFINFSDGFVAVDQTQNYVLGDLRYSMLPISAKPLWGIVVDYNNPYQHADYRFFRDNDQQIRQTFINMLLGHCALVNC